MKGQKMSKPSWTDGDCAQWVLEWATIECAKAREESLKANIDERMRATAEAEWNRHNTDVGIGAFGGNNPYRVRGTCVAEERERLGLAAERWAAVLNFVGRRICSCLDDPNQKENHGKP